MLQKSEKLQIQGGASAGLLLLGELLYIQGGASENMLQQVEMLQIHPGLPRQARDFHPARAESPT
jgi:hypothetical protein